MRGVLLAQMGWRVDERVGGLKKGGVCGVGVEGVWL